MKFYVVIDTNVLVSALLKSNSNPDFIIKLVRSKTIIPLVNDKILSEYRNVLSRPKFKFLDVQIDNVLKELINEALYIKEDHIEIELPDEKDRVFYEVTMKSNEERDSMLVTGNIKHFPIESFIVTPKELCDIVINALSKEEFTILEKELKSRDNVS